MPDRRQHRGPHPGDRERFGAEQVPALRSACAHLGWLLENGYAQRAATQLVGDRFALDKRQREAVQRGACAPSRAAARRARQLPLGPLPELWIDGFNVLTTIEVALGGGAVLVCADGCLRDVASVHGTWRRVEETEPAAGALAGVLAAAGVGRVVIWLDAPVGNSGRLAAILRRTADERGLPWRVEVVASPDAVLARAPVPIATADSAVLDGRVQWIDLAGAVVSRIADAWLVPLV